MGVPVSCSMATFCWVLVSATTATRWVQPNLLQRQPLLVQANSADSCSFRTARGKALLLAGGAVDNSCSQAPCIFIRVTRQGVGPDVATLPLTLMTFLLLEAIQDPLRTSLVPS